ncbi:protein HIDE1 isoform X2 [Hyperolius riggenbachi]|uniref:protein HIDE1 isoform X2 n=1 Tax=Hyperolius riggenbachi TaxID=752182 RepID=UPI0035A2B6F6
MNMELLLLLAIVGVEIMAVRSDPLPAPELSLLTPVTYKGRPADLQCTAADTYPEATFSLYSQSQVLLEEKTAPETKTSVTFTVQPPASGDTMTYTCAYQHWVQGRREMSLLSNVVTVTLLDEATSTVPSENLQASVPVPLWVILLIAGLVGFVILVAVVSLIVCIMRRHEQKRQEERDKEAIWIDHGMAKDWTLGHHNKTFPTEGTSETEFTRSYSSKKDSFTYNGSLGHFSTFRK